MVPRGDADGVRRPSEEGFELSLVGFANVLLRNLPLLIAIPGVFVAVMLAVVLLSARSYVATTSFVPQGAEGATSSAAAGLARQFGVDLGRDRFGQSPQFYVDLLNGETILRMAAESEYQVKAEDGSVVTATLVDLLDGGGGRMTPLQRTVEKLRRMVSVSVTRETGIVTLNASAKDPALAEQIAGRLLELMNQFNLGARQRRAQEEGRFVASRLEEAQRELMEAEREQERFLNANRAFRNSPELLLEYERHERRVLMRQELYTSLLRSYDQVRIDAMRDTPVLTVIDEPSARPEPRRGLVRLLLAGTIGLMIAVLLALFREVMSKARAVGDPDYQEFSRLTRSVQYRLRHPLRTIPAGTRSGEGD